MTSLIEILTLQISISFQLLILLITLDHDCHVEKMIIRTLSVIIVINKLINTENSRN